MFNYFLLKLIRFIGKMWHIKDMSAKHDATFSTDGEQYFTEAGSGVINYKKIFEYKKESGMEYFYVEQDQTKIPVYESIAKSYKYAKELSKE